MSTYLVRIETILIKNAIDVEVRLYNHLFSASNPDETKEGEDFLSNLNPDSVEVLSHCKAEPSLQNAKVGENFQFLRKGYFCLDSDSKDKDSLIINRTASLRDSWTKTQRTQEKKYKTKPAQPGNDWSGYRQPGQSPRNHR